jgi:hypothetical protein
MRHIPTKTEEAKTANAGTTTSRHLINIDMEQQLPISRNDCTKVAQLVLHLQFFFHGDDIHVGVVGCCGFAVICIPLIPRVSYSFSL